jgi:tRNA-splicing ligase RtcB
VAIEQHGEMRVAGRVFASSALVPNIATDEALRQVANAATLPGIVEAS